MRIVQASGWYFPDSIGGTEVYVDALSQRLTHRGHDVIVAVPESGGTAEREYTHAGIAVYRYPTSRTVTRAQARGLDVVPGAEHFHRFLARTRADVVHFHTFVTGLSLRELRAARSASDRVIVTSHAGSLGFLCERGTLMRDGVSLCDGAVPTGVCASCALTMRGVPTSVARMAGRLPRAVSSAALSIPGPIGTAAGMRALVDANRRAQRELLDTVDWFVVLSDWAAHAVAAAGAPAHKVVVNRLGIPAVPDARSRRDSRRRLVCGFAGRADAIKGLEDVVRAVVSLPRTVQLDLCVVAIATTANDRALLERCKHLSAGDRRVSFEAAVSPGAMPSLLTSFDVLLCPSRVLEGGPTIALEARAVGTPVIGSRLPALTEIVRDGVDGMLHDPGSPDAIAACLQQIAANPAGTIDVWRERLPAPRTADDVADDYLALYRAA